MKYILLVLFYGRMTITPFDNASECGRLAGERMANPDVIYSVCRENWPCDEKED